MAIFFVHDKKQQNPTRSGFVGFAVREGFEPSVQFPVRQFSKLILSASQAPHQVVFSKTPFSGTANIAIRLSHQKKFNNQFAHDKYS